MATKEEPATFKARVNVVMVPVVVRDGKGQAIGSLRQEDFQLFDRGKQQTITKFSVEKSGAHVPPMATGNIGTEETVPPDDIPDRFIAYLFDDMHLEFPDIVRTRDAAEKHLQTLLKTDRAAIYTTSGQVQQEFTDDKEKLHEALARVIPRSISDSRSGLAQCPEISEYMADMIVNHNDSQALTLAIQEYQACSGNSNMPANAITAMIQGMSQQVLSVKRQETHVTLLVLKDVIRRMAGMPGQRTIIMVSPGFLATEEQSDKMELMDKAIHGNVIISSMDARGLWVDPTIDVTRRASYTQSYTILKNQYDRASASAQSDVLAELAMGTGGSFFQNNNDLEGGLKRLATAPEYYYLLGFSPQNLKLDGTFHAIKVSAKSQPSLSLVARKGYYAPKKLSDAAETAKEEIEEALFSRDELHDLPVELKTQFFKANEKDATISVFCHVDPKHLQFKKGDGRNSNTLTIVQGVFDRNGNLLSGIQKTVEMHLKDETLTKLDVSGMAIRTNFSVTPGTYVVRLVVRDSEGQNMAAANAAVAIP